MIAILANYLSANFALERPFFGEFVPLFVGGEGSFADEFSAHVALDLVDVVFGVVRLRVATVLGDHCGGSGSRIGI